MRVGLILGTELLGTVVSDTMLSLEEMAKLSDIELAITEEDFVSSDKVDPADLEVIDLEKKHLWIVDDATDAKGLEVSKKLPLDTSREDGIKLLEEEWASLTFEEQRARNGFCLLEAPIWVKASIWGDGDGIDTNSPGDGDIIVDFRTLQHDGEADAIAAAIRNSQEWDKDLNCSLCELAGMSDELEQADGETFEEVVEKAADKLGVSIY